MEHQTEKVEIDLLELFHYLKKRIWIIAAAFVLCAVAGFIFSEFMMAPEYTASTRIYVLNRTNENNVVYSDFQISTQMHNDYKVLITGENVTKEVIARLGLDMAPEQLAGKIEVTAPDNTRVLQISITEKSPLLAANIANAVREVAAEQIKSIMDVDAVKLVYEADVPDEPSGPHVLRNTVLLAALGFVGAVGVLAVVFVLDDTMRTEEDVERYLGLGTLGVIPVTAELNAASAKTNRKNNIVLGRGSARKI